MWHIIRRIYIYTVCGCVLAVMAVTSSAGRYTLASVQAAIAECEKRRMRIASSADLLQVCGSTFQSRFQSRSIYLPGFMFVNEPVHSQAYAFLNFHLYTFVSVCALTIKIDIIVRVRISIYVVEIGKMCIKSGVRTCNRLHSSHMMC